MWGAPPQARFREALHRALAWEADGSAAGRDLIFIGGGTPSLIAPAGWPR